MKNTLNALNKLTVCFTGHRPQKLPWRFNENDARCVEMKTKLENEIENAIKRGYKIFLCGMALGFDMMSAEIVLKLKTKHPDIKLIAAIPCKNQYEVWTSAQKERYKKLLAQVDAIRCVYDKYVDGCMQERNRYMLNNSSLVIALFNGKNGGTKQTIEEALSQGLEVKIISC